MSARGIHAHPTRKLGRQETVDPNKPALMLADILTGQVPAHPASADFIGTLRFPMNGNDRIGDCLPVDIANDMIATSAFCGTPFLPSEKDVVSFYSLVSGYDPRTGANDIGCEFQDALEKLLAHGMGNGKGETVKPIAFAKANANDTDTNEAGVSIFGGASWGIDLEEAQQEQTDAEPPVWDYRKSPEWGGHAVYVGAYSGADLKVISWEEEIGTTPKFRESQVEETWFIIWPWHLTHPAFQEGVDLGKLAEAYKALTGRELPLPSPTPTPTPEPAPEGETATAADRALWEAVQPWSEARHVGANKRAAKAVRAWAQAEGLSARTARAIEAFKRIS